MTSVIAQRSQAALRNRLNAACGMVHGTVNSCRTRCAKGWESTMSGDGREVHRELQRAFPSVYGPRPVVVPGRPQGRPQGPQQGPRDKDRHKDRDICSKYIILLLVASNPGASDAPGFEESVLTSYCLVSAKWSTQHIYNSNL